MYSAVSRIQAPTGEWQGNLYWRISVLSGVLPPFWTEDHLQTSGKAWSASREQVTNMERQSPGFLIKSTLKLLGERKREENNSNKRFRSVRAWKGHRRGPSPTACHVHTSHGLCCARAPPGRQAGRALREGNHHHHLFVHLKQACSESLTGTGRTARLLHAPPPRGPASRFGGSRGSPAAPETRREAAGTGGSPTGPRSLGGRFLLGRPEAGPPPPRVVSPRPCPPRGPRPLPSSVPGFLAAMPRATGGSPARLRPPRSRPAAAGSGGDTGRAAPGRAVPCPGEAVSPGSRGGKPDCPPCFKRRRQMPPRCPR